MKTQEEINKQFIEACQHGDLVLVQYCLTSPELTYHADIHAEDGCGFLHACDNGHLEVVRYLLTSPELKEHADIHEQNDVALILACQKGYLDVVQYLLTSPELTEHIDVNVARDLSYYTGEEWCTDIEVGYIAVVFAYIDGHLEMVHYLLTSNTFQSPTLDRLFLTSCEFNFLDIIKWIYESPNGQNAINHNKGFQRVCQNGHLDIVRYLLTSPDIKKHADIHANGDKGFELACKEGRLNIIHYLLTSPELTEHIDIHANGDHGFVMACKFGHLDIVRYLLTSPELTEHANIHAEDGMALVLACDNGHLEVVRYLLTSQDLTDHANIRASDKYPDLPFIATYINKHIDIIYYLTSSPELKTRVPLINEATCSVEVLFNYFGKITANEMVARLLPDDAEQLMKDHGDALYGQYVLHAMNMPDNLMAYKHYLKPESMDTEEVIYF